jgi:hypothetical protein
MADLNLPDPEALAKARESAADVAIDNSREVPVWEQDDAPKGSTAESLLVYERGVPVRVAGPTHYHHLVDGRIVGGYGHATHYSEPGAKPGDPDKLTRIHAVYGG